jgi:DNA-binding response OmpR family regulator
MRNEAIRVLLIEDDFRFVELLKAWLEEVPEGGGSSPPLHLESVDSLAGALSRLEAEPPDIVLTDLNLPDSQGLVTCEQILEHAGSVPVIILSGLDDEALAIQAMGRGAQDYLLKSLLDGRQLLRSIRYALERNHLQRELEQVRQVQLQQREQESMDRLNERSGGSTPLTAQLLGVQNLEQGQPDVFAQMIERLVVTWEHVVEMRTHKVVYNVSQELRELAWEMGLLKCGPRDVVALYRAALLQVERSDKPRRNEIVHEEGRYLAFELMGNLVSYYRPYALGGLPRSPASGARI